MVVTHQAGPFQLLRTCSIQAPGTILAGSSTYTCHIGNESAAINSSVVSLSRRGCNSMENRSSDFECLTAGEQL